jgi:hypothetical protein
MLDFRASSIDTAAISNNRLGNATVVSNGDITTVGVMHRFLL